MYTVSYFDKQQVILTNSKQFWLTINNFDKRKLFWQKASNFDKQQVILTKSK